MRGCDGAKGASRLGSACAAPHAARRAPQTSLALTGALMHELEVRKQTTSRCFDRCVCAGLHGLQAISGMTSHALSYSS